MIGVIALLSCLGTVSALNVKAWQSTAQFQTAADFPESEVLKNKPNTAIAFTGGGSRAYTAAIGHLAGLRDLDLLKNVRYIGGISGGAWATMSYVYAQHTADDQVLLGTTIPPEEITVDRLNQLDQRCLLYNTYKNLTLVALEGYSLHKEDGIAAAWVYGVSKTYLEPIGIQPGKYFSWNDASVSDILSRNRGLSKDNFIVPKGSKPYPVIGTTVVGPANCGPFDSKNQNYTMVEITPLYVGQMNTIDVKYEKKLGLDRTRRVGGALEPFGFAVQGKAPVFALSSDKTSDSLNVPAPTKPLDVQWAAGASSYAPGSFVSSLRPDNLTAMSMHIDYWAPADHWPTTTDTYFADGGAFENVPIISFLQRKVDRIVFFNTGSIPLQPSEKYNPYTDPIEQDSITNVISAYFGILPPEANWQNRSYEYEKNQVFAKEDYPKVVVALQEAQKAGNGIVAKFDLVTVENKWRGIPAGFKVTIIFSYLGRLSEWEKRLKPEMYDLLVPHENATDLSHDITDGPYKSFPHYMTMGGSIDADNANVLASLAGWQVTQNADMFRSVLA